ncbi:MAG: ABC transporter ATP-binding protein [Anaerolineae bacterium]|nr:ABC transporter ATP-binding protein [Anaerolineae bacterium]
MSDVVIETRGLTRRFRKVVAVDHLDLTIYRGEIFGLLGPDSAGKTTTLRLLCGLMRPSEGSARVAGCDTVRQAEALKRQIGYMPQQFSLYGDLTVMENLLFFADIFDVREPERSQRIERLLRFAGLAEFTGRRAAYLSGGMKQKLALACALLHQPPILLLDEPTTGVDPVSRREFWQILTELHLAGVTLVITTPYMDEAERCTRVGLMYQGRLMVCDTPARIRQMIEGEVIELQVGAFRQARLLLQDAPGVLEVQTYGEMLHLIVDNAEEHMPAIAARLEEAGIPVLSMRRTRARMEEAFISLIRRQNARLQAEITASGAEGHGG